MDIHNAILNGVEWLDENGPAEWWDRIDTSKLDLNDSNVCVLGQVFKPQADETGIRDGYLFTQTLFTEHGGLATSLEPQEAWNEWAEMLEECGFSYSLDPEASHLAWTYAIDNRRAEVHA